MANNVVGLFTCLSASSLPSFSLRGLVPISRRNRLQDETFEILLLSRYNGCFISEKLLLGWEYESF